MEAAAMAAAVSPASSEPGADGEIFEAGLYVSIKSGRTNFA